jgi:hypothetical protein
MARKGAKGQQKGAKKKENLKTSVLRLSFVFLAPLRDLV